MSSNNGGSRLSIYSHASTTRSTRTLGAHSRGVSLKSTRVPWWRRPLVASAFYTDLTTAAWHVTFYTLALSAWTGITSLFDCYLLEEAKPGSSHTGYYLFSFDFVKVYNNFFLPSNGDFLKVIWPDGNLNLKISQKRLLFLLPTI